MSKEETCIKGEALVLGPPVGRVHHIFSLLSSGFHLLQSCFMGPLDASSPLSRLNTELTLATFCPLSLAGPAILVKSSSLGACGHQLL